jgi:hypothetical protein
LIALHGVDRIFVELAKMYKWKYDGGSESKLQYPETKGRISIEET